MHSVNKYTPCWSSSFPPHIRPSTPLLIPQPSFIPHFNGVEEKPFENGLDEL